VRFLKQEIRRAVVKRVTKVLEDDCEGDEVVCTNDKLELKQKVSTEQMDRDIQGWLTEFSDIVKKELGLTD